VQARQDAKNLFTPGSRIQFEYGPFPFSFALSPAAIGSTNIVVHKGDTREVEEEPPEISFADPEIEDSIYDDVSMEYQFFRAVRDRERLVTSLTTLSEFAKEPSGNTVPTNDLAIFPRLIAAFVLSVRRWANVDMKNLKQHTFKDDLWKRLVLPVGYKETLLSLVQNHERTGFNERNVFRQKGSGIGILLQGYPGTGKSMPAETLAAKTKRVLYPLSSGELGDEVGAIETKLRQILQRGRRWGCVLLLDEADVYFIKRVEASFKRNSIQSVFLRQIEYYSGIIIMMTNFNASMDHSFINRVTLAYVYPPLNKNAVRQIWKFYVDNISQFVTDHGHGKPKVSDESGKGWEKVYDEANAKYANTDQLGEKEESPWWSGRQLRTAFRLAVSLALRQAVRDQGRALRKDDFVHLTTQNFVDAFSASTDFSCLVSAMPDKTRDGKAIDPPNSELEYTQIEQGDDIPSDEDPDDKNILYLEPDSDNEGDSAS
jgi:hypothetical protein